MLSYRHAFHAGNHADVLKHCVLISVLDYMTQKDAPLLYVDTHAGAGMYRLQDEWADKTRDHETGITRLWHERDSTDAPQAVQMYMREIRELNPHNELQEYPGSPWIAQSMLRQHDRARLFELHSSEYSNLDALFASSRRFKVEQADGFQALNGLMPPSERRAVVLIDPSYEVKTDYQTVLQSVKAAYKKFATGIYLIWYPVVNRKWINRFEQGFLDSGMRNVLQAELSIKPDSEQSGMTGSGMIIINPPWLLAESLKQALPYLQHVLSDGRGACRIQTMIPE